MPLSLSARICLAALCLSSGARGSTANDLQSITTSLAKLSFRHAGFEERPLLGSALIFSQQNQVWALSVEHVVLNNLTARYPIPPNVSCSLAREEGKALPCHLAWSDWGLGIALIKVDTALKNLGFVPLSFEELKAKFILSPAKPGLSTFLAGFPLSSDSLNLDVEAQVKNSATSTDYLADLPQMIEIQGSRAEFGMSGGIAFTPDRSTEGSILGLISHQKLSRGQNSIFLIPAHVIDQTLSRYFSDPENFSLGWIRPAFSHFGGIFSLCSQGVELSWMKSQHPYITVRSNVCDPRARWPSSKQEYLARLAQRLSTAKAALPQLLGFYDPRATTSFLNVRPLNSMALVLRELQNPERQPLVYFDPPYHGNPTMIEDPKDFSVAAWSYLQQSANFSLGPYRDYYEEQKFRAQMYNFPNTFFEVPEHYRYEKPYVTNPLKLRFGGERVLSPTSRQRLEFILNDPATWQRIDPDAAGNFKFKLRELLKVVEEFFI